MLKSEIKVGGLYKAKVSNRIATVRVDSIRPDTFGKTCYDVTNLDTGRHTTFRSAAKFRSTVEPIKVTSPKIPSSPTVDKAVAEGVLLVGTKVAEAEQRSDPTSAGRSATSAAEPSREEIPAAAPTISNGQGYLAASQDHQASYPQEPRPMNLAAALTSKPVDNAPHLIIEARAGTGKTTTLVEGLKRIKGIPSDLTPSPQQAAVWDAMALSRGVAHTICFVAFNKSIAEELKSRVPEGCQASTMHSMGFGAVRKAFGNVRVEQYRVQDLICQALGMDIYEVRRKKQEVLKATEDLVGLCKMNLWDGSEAELDRLASHYDVELEGIGEEVFALVPQVLDLCKDVKKDGRIDYDDMIWIPIALGLNIFRYDLLLVDEAQDLNRCQQELAKRAGRRLILCGDPCQAIYGFAGADSESMNRMFKELGGITRNVWDGKEQVAHSDRGCTILPLTVTRRCGKAIVKEAQKIVPDFEAHESNPEGAVRSMAYSDKAENCYMKEARDGDFGICRVNAPLVSQCFRFIKEGRKATIIGRDIGRGLISTVTKQKASSVVELSTKLPDWLHAEQAKEQAKRFPNENKLISLQDRVDCIMCFTEGATTVEEVIAKIESIFREAKDAVGIRLSSIHKAKGLEARRVFLLEPDGASVPHPMAKTAWQKGQEMNLRYVAITRAIEELIYVS